MKSAFEAGLTKQDGRNSVADVDFVEIQIIDEFLEIRIVLENQLTPCLMFEGEKF